MWRNSGTNVSSDDKGTPMVSLKNHKLCSKITIFRLWVQPRLYLQYHQWSRKAESINVTHYVVTYQDVLTHLQKESFHKKQPRFSDCDFDFRDKFYPSAILF